MEAHREVVMVAPGAAGCRRAGMLECPALSIRAATQLALPLKSRFQCLRQHCHTVSVGLLSTCSVHAGAKSGTGG